MKTYATMGDYIKATPKEFVAKGEKTNSLRHAGHPSRRQFEGELKTKIIKFRLKEGSRGY